MGFLYWSWDKQAGKRVGMTLLMLNVWAPMIKNVFLRRRPYLDHEGIALKRLVDPNADAGNIAAQGFSLPSGHSANIAGLGTSMTLAFRKGLFAGLAVILSLLVGVSRVVVGAHYPTDVICGWVLGILTAILIPALERKIRNRRAFNGILLLTALPGLFYCRSTDYFTGLGLLVGFIAGSAVEEKYVCFENTRNPLRAILRVIGGGLIFLGLNSILKRPFPSDFLNSGAYAALLVRSARYAVSTFVAFAIYPMLFKYTAAIGKKKTA